MLLNTDLNLALLMCHMSLEDESMQASVLLLAMAFAAHTYRQTKRYNWGQRQNKTIWDVQDETLLTI